MSDLSATALQHPTEMSRLEAQHARRFTFTRDGAVVGAEAVHLEGAGDRAVLLIHGFNDTPQSMAYLAASMHRAGWTALAPRLSGHGVSLSRMAREARAASWRAELAQAYAQLRRDHEHVMVCGQSMGGALAVLLAADLNDLQSLVLLAPYVGMPISLQLQIGAAWLLHPWGPYRESAGGERSIHDPDAKARALGPGIITARTMTELRKVARGARSALSRVRAPTLYLQSRTDNRIPTEVAERNFRALGSREKVQGWLTGCGHIISADYCRDEVARQVIAWGERHAVHGIATSHVRD